MDSVSTRSEVESADTERIHGMAARHPARQAGVLRQHRRCRRPRRIDALAGYLGHTCPAILLPRDGDRVAYRLAGLRYEIKPAIAEADDDLAGCELKRTISRPLPPTSVPPPQSQRSWPENSCADAGPNEIPAQKIKAALAAMRR